MLKILTTHKPSPGNITGTTHYSWPSNQKIPARRKNLIGQTSLLSQSPAWRSSRVTATLSGSAVESAACSPFPQVIDTNLYQKVFFVYYIMDVTLFTCVCVFLFQISFGHVDATSSGKLFSEFQYINEYICTSQYIFQTTHILN